MRTLHSHTHTHTLNLAVSQDGARVERPTTSSKQQCTPAGGYTHVIDGAKPKARVPMLIARLYRPFHWQQQQHTGLTTDALLGVFARAYLWRISALVLTTGRPLRKPDGLVALGSTNGWP